MSDIGPNSFAHFQFGTLNSEKDKYLKVGVSPSKHNSFLFAEGKPFKNNKKCFLFHLESSVRSHDI